MGDGFKYHQPADLDVIASSVAIVNNVAPTSNIVNYTNTNELLLRGERLEFEILIVGLIAGIYPFTIYFNEIAGGVQGAACAKSSRCFSSKIKVFFGCIIMDIVNMGIRNRMGINTRLNI